MAESAISYIEGATVNLACFEVRGQVFALDVSSIREIVRLQPVTPLPNAPRLIEGVVDLRGAVVPVIDLARVLGLGSAAEGAQARIVVLELDGLLLGLWVDSATDVLTLDASRLQDVPDLAAQSGYDAVRHVIRQEGEAPVMVLGLEALIERVYRSALSGSAVGGAVR